MQTHTTMLSQSSMPLLPNLMSQASTITMPMHTFHDYMSQSAPITTPRRHRIQRACIACRRRKIKCNGNLEGCEHCAEKDQRCRYEAVPDDEKLKARSYKRQLIQRRQQTQVYWESRYPEPNTFPGAFGTRRPTMGGGFSHVTASATYPLYGNMHPQNVFVASPYSTTPVSSPMERDFNPYFGSFTSPPSSTHLQGITGTCSFSHPIPAQSVLESLPQTPSLSSSLSSPALSVSSSTGSLLTPMSETFYEVNAPLSATLQPSFQQQACDPAQVHVHDFAGGLELYNVPCMAPTMDGFVDATTSGHQDIAMMATPAPSAESSNFSSPEHVLLPLPASYDFVSLFGTAIAHPTLAGTNA